MAIKELTIKMKSKRDIEMMFEDIDELSNSFECTIKPYKDRINIDDDMIDTIAGKEIKVFPYKGHGSYTYRHWHDDTDNDNGNRAWYILPDWVEYVIEEGE